MAKKKGSKGKQNKPSSGLIVYRGPINSASAIPQTLRIPLKQRYAVASGSAGFIETYLQTSNVLNFPEFGTYAPLWREYRVLGLRFQYMPWYDMSGYTGSGQTYSSGVIAPYHGAPPSFQGAVTSSTDLAVWQMDGSQVWHPCKPVTLEWRMSDVEEAQYFSTSTSLALGGIYGVVPTVTASRTFGTLYATVLVEFKGRL